MEFKGYHLIAELYDIELDKLENLEAILEATKKSITDSGATLLKLDAHKFDPEGLTVFAVLAESHLSIHTYPEQNALFLDAFTCGKEDQPKKILESLEEYFKPKKLDYNIIIRGK